MKRFLSIVGLPAALFCACSNSVDISPSDGTSDVFEVDSLSGMLLVKSADKQVSLGTEESSAKSNERPVMHGRFDYDFSIGRREVTCAAFNSVMKSELGVSLDCAGENIPATNLTFFDAALYANARSKAERFDTAYTYIRATFDANGRCTNLEGFAFHPEVAAYRLPTEAEWVYAASQAWSTKDAWTAENSDYKLHEVCLKESAEDVPCDMAGNAMEWVNDWLGSFRDTTVTDYVGAPDGGALGQRVVKGGSYRNAAESITLYSRGDVYTVTSSTKADYVGFRVAFGAIPAATWLNSSGSAVSSRIVTLANSSTVRYQTGTYRTKLAFRNDLTGNLAYVDYSNRSVSVTEIEDSLDVYHPDISPDGKRVAFCTGLEGVSGKSSLYVRDMNANGTHLVKLDVESAAIPRWRVLGNGDTVIVYVTDAGNNKDESAFKSASTWQVKFAEGKFGKPEKLFDGAYHGGISDDDALAITGARLLRARIAESGSSLAGNARDTVWYNGEQACNASLAKDSSKRTLFLDFASKTGREFVGENYGTHERLLVMDSTGNLVHAVAAPATYSFDHSEWAIGGGNLAVATLANSGGAHVKIVLLNLADDSLIELVEGEEIWHPSLWYSRNTSSGDDSLLDLDSAGVYLADFQGNEEEKYRIKMEMFWKNLDKTRYLLVGSSRMEMGIDPDAYPEWNMLNMGVSGIDPNRDFYFINNYALNHSDNLKGIVVSVDLDGWNGVEDHLYLIQYAVPGYKYDANHDFWKDGIPSGFVEAVENAYPASQDLTESFTERGGLANPCRGWDSDEVAVLRDSVFTPQATAHLDSMIGVLADIAESAAARGIYVIGVIFPQAPQYRETGSFGLYGLQRSVVAQKIARLDSLAKANNHFILMDENRMGDHDYSGEMAFNRDHLCSAGATKMASRLDSLLRTLK